MPGLGTRSLTTNDGRPGGRTLRCASVPQRPPRLQTSRVVTDAQRKMCKRYGVAPVPTPDELKVGLARGGGGPVHGLRHSPEGDTSGWYIWRGELSDAT